MASREDIDHQLKMLDIHRRNARVYSRQLGLNTPRGALPGQVSGMEMELQAIQRIKGILNSWSVEPLPAEVDNFDLSPYLQQ